MKIAVIGANGKAGQLIVKEAVSRGHDVTAVVRKDNALFDDKVHILIKDLFKLAYEDLKTFDALVDAFGVFEPDLLHLHQTSLKHLTDILRNKSNRLLVVGGAGSLYITDDHTLRLSDAADFPDAFKPLALAMAKALDQLKHVDDVNWTYLSPAADFVADGARTCHYLLGSENLLLNSKGESQISYADYAIAMVDEIESAKHIKQRFTVVSG